MGTGPDGERCVRWTTVDLGRPATAADHAAAEHQFQLFIRVAPVCEGAERPRPSPAAVALDVVRRLQLPAPEPYIAPGRMLVGLRAYLESRSPLEFHHAESTELGTIEVTARARLTVDWGDGTVTGPHDTPGGPYPDGTIVHVYQHAGHYDVVVRATWVADWAVAGVTGTIDSGLETTGTLADFPVEAREAVITRA